MEAIKKFLGDLEQSLGRNYATELTILITDTDLENEVSKKVDIKI